MGEFANVLSLTSQFPFCGFPLRLDSYRGCSFACRYCFARLRGGAGDHSSVSAADPHRLARIMEWTFSREPADSGIVGQLLHHRVPIHFGGMADPFQHAESRRRTSLAFLRTLRDYDYPTVISTKSTMVGEPDYLRALTDMRSVIVQFSFCTTEPKQAEELEPAAPKPREILRTMHLLSSAGIPVTVRWQPFIPGISEAPTKFVRRVAATGAQHVGFEHIKIALDGSNEFIESLKSRHVTMNLKRDGREHVIRPEHKIERALEVRRLCHDYGLSFGAADNDIQYLSDTSCCCSGIDRYPRFDRYMRHQIGFALRTLREATSVRYSSIRGHWTPTGSIERFLNSKSRLTPRSGGSGSLADHVRHRWNTLGSSAEYFGLRDTEKVDSHGDRVYAWDLPAWVHAELRQ